jgi:hypothetical protein
VKIRDADSVREVESGIKPPHSKARFARETKIRVR